MLTKVFGKRGAGKRTFFQKGFFPAKLFYKTLFVDFSVLQAEGEGGAVCRAGLYCSLYIVFPVFLAVLLRGDVEFTMEYTMKVSSAFETGAAGDVFYGKAGVFQQFARCFQTVFLSSTQKRCPNSR